MIFCDSFKDIHLIWFPWIELIEYLVGKESTVSFGCKECYGTQYQKTKTAHLVKGGKTKLCLASPSTVEIQGPFFFL